MKKLKKKHFTLIEMMVVIGIITLLAGMVMGTSRIIEIKKLNHQAKTQLMQLKIALDLYRDEFGFYPRYDSSSTTPIIFNFAEQLSATPTSSSAPASPPRKMFLNFEESRFEINNPQFANGNATATILKDPYGKEWYYLCPGKMNSGSYDLWSRGPDGEHGKATTSPGSPVTSAQVRSVNDDITNWRSK